MRCVSKFGLISISVSVRSRWCSLVEGMWETPYVCPEKVVGEDLFFVIVNLVLFSFVSVPVSPGFNQNVGCPRMGLFFSDLGGGHRQEADG